MIFNKTKKIICFLFSFQDEITKKQHAVQFVCVCVCVFTKSNEI